MQPPANAPICLVLDVNRLGQGQPIQQDGVSEKQDSIIQPDANNVQTKLVVCVYPDKVVVAHERA